MTTGTVWSQPNYSGALYTASPTRTPFLSMIGGLSEGGKTTDNFEFPTSSDYTITAAAQPAITETASLTALTAAAPKNFTRSQSKNVTQIFMETVSVSYVNLSNPGRLSGINTAGQQNSIQSELEFQIATSLLKIARDVEYTFINGAYQIAIDAGVANKTKGMLALCAANTTVAASGATNSKDLMNSLFRAMYAAGALFQNAVMFVNMFQKQTISTIYGYAPTDRNIGGTNINQIETDAGVIGIVLDPFMPTDTVLVADVSVCAPVFQPVPDDRGGMKGLLFYEQLSKSGAAESGQIFGQIGLDHGPAFAHGTITGLATS